jgi:hypothetical protein
MISTKTFWLLFIEIMAAIFIFAVSYPALLLRHVISRVESANTPQEERAAFRLVRRYYYGYYYINRTNEVHTFWHSNWVRQGQPFVIIFTDVSLQSHNLHLAERTLLADTNLNYLMGSYGSPVPY